MKDLVCALLEVRVHSCLQQMMYLLYLILRSLPLCSSRADKRAFIITVNSFRSHPSITLYPSWGKLYPVELPLAKMEDHEQVKWVCL